MSQPLDHTPPGLTIEVLNQLLPQLAHHMHLMHTCGVVHQDIKLSNIMMDHNTGAAHIIDFGVSVKMSSEPPQGRCGATLAYQPPETFRSKMYKVHASVDW
jgi:cyclin-dependent kinase